MTEPSTSLLIRQTRLLDPATRTDKQTDVLIKAGNIVAIKPDIDQKADKRLTANGRWLMPGLVDIGMPALPTNLIARESLAAASGGITHLAVYSSRHLVIDNLASLQLLQQTTEQSSQVQFFPIAAMTQGLSGEQLADMQTLASSGAIAVSNGQQPVVDNRVLKRCFEYAATFDLLVTICPQDQTLSANGQVHDGEVAARLGLPGIPASAETLALSRALLLAEETGVRLHIHHLSCAASLRLLKNARANGVKVTADVCIHHLLADESHINGFDSHFHLMPPLRQRTDRDALIAGVADGTIDAICSQHQPLATADRQQPFSSTLPGIAGTETLLPLVLSLVDTGQLSLMRAIDAITAAPARCFGLSAGTINEGSKASLCLVDQDNRQRPIEHWLSTGINSPWRHTKLPGKILLTLCDGHETWCHPDCQ